MTFFVQEGFSMMRKQEKIQRRGCFDNLVLPVGMPISGSLTVMIKASSSRKEAGEKKKRKNIHSRKEGQ